MDLVEIISYNYTFVYVVILMMFLLFTSRKIEVKHRRHFIVLVLVLAVECTCNNLQRYLENTDICLVGLLIVTVVSYIFRSIVFYMIFLLVIRELSKRFKILMSIPILLVTISSLSAFGTNLVFSYSKKGEMIHGVLYPVVHVSLGFYLICIVIFAIIYAKDARRRRECMILILSAFFVLFSMLDKHIVPGLSISMSGTISLSVLAYYIYFRSMEHMREYDDLEMEYMKERVSMLETDDLTKLYTKSAFYQYAQALIDANPEKIYGIVAMDVSNFKFANIQYGSEKCDEFLLYVAKCIKKMFPLGVYGRTSGDKFVAIYERAVSMDADTVNRVTEGLMKNAPIPGQIVKFGIYPEIDKSLSIARCCDNAFAALKSIKGIYNTNYAFYNEEMTKEVSLKQRITDSMENALDQEQFLVYYQPKHDTYTGKLVGAEALVRWNHPEMGFMSPSQFVPIFEQNGFITKLDSYVVRKVILDLSNWMKEGKKVVPVSINVSRKDFFEKEWIERHMLLADYSGVDAQFIHFEVTESLYMEDDNLIIHYIKMLREKGYQIEMDDFGSGYSSLGTMANFPLDIVKLDISFIRNISSNRIMVEAIINMVHRMGYKVISEGVETEREVQLLQKLGCDFIQGYFFSKPLPKGEYELYLGQQHGDSSLFKSAIKNHDNWSQITHDSEIKNALLDCMSVLSKEGNEIQSVMKLLEIIGKFYGADRTYIFETTKSSEFKQYRGEWCNDGMESHEYAFHMGDVRNGHRENVFYDKMPEGPVDEEGNRIDLPDLDKIYENVSWMSQYDENGNFYLKSAESMKTAHPIMYLMLKNLKIDSFISSLIRKDGEIIALVGVDNPTVHTDSLELIPAVSRLLMGEIIRNRELVKEYLIDDLTGVYSVKYLDFWRRNNKPLFPFSVLVCDCNYLKQFNDRFGHECGDKLLEKTGELIRESLPDHCKIIRTGGDEFLALCDAVDEKTADGFIQDILENAKTKKIKGQELSIAIGRCCVNEEQYDFDVVRAIADKEMYAMKNAMKAKMQL